MAPSATSEAQRSHVVQPGGFGHPLWHDVVITLSEEAGNK
jgi:hypothetical protein